MAKSKTTPLHLGFNSVEELSSWRGCRTKDSFKNHYSKYKKDLEKYCSFEPCYETGQGRPSLTGVDIKEIFSSRYFIKESQRNSLDYKQLLVWLPPKVEELKEGKLSFKVGTYTAFADEYKNESKSKEDAKKIAAFISEILYNFYGDGALKREGEKGRSLLVRGVSVDHKGRYMTYAEYERWKEIFKEIVLAYTDEEVNKVLTGLDIAKEYGVVGEDVAENIVEKVKKQSYGEKYIEARYAFFKEIGGWPIVGKLYQNGFLEWELPKETEDFLLVEENVTISLKEKKEEGAF
jgi:hypothetical protein